MKMCLKVSSAKWRPFCLDPNVLRKYETKVWYIYKTHTWLGQGVQLLIRRWMFTNENWVWQYGVAALVDCLWHIFMTTIRHVYVIYTRTKSPRNMMTSSNGNIFCVTGICAGNSPVNGEFPAQRTVRQSFDVFFDMHPNKRLSKQSWGWWFETPSHPLLHHCNDTSQ